MKQISASIEGILAPIKTTNGACFTPRSMAAAFRRNESVLTASHYHISAQLHLDQIPEPLRNIEDQFFFGITTGSDTAGVVPPMSSVDDYARKFQSQTSNK